MEENEEDTNDEGNATCFNPLCSESMDSVTKELAEATNRIKILKRQLAQQSDKNGGHNGHNRLIYRPIRGDTILRHHHKRRTFPTPDEMETVL